MWRCTLVFQFPPARTWCLSPHSPLSLSISLTFTAAPPFSPAPSSACWPRCQKRYNVSALNTQPVEGIRIWPQLIFFKQILFILYHVEKIKKRNLFSFWNGIDLSSRGIISTLCCYTEGGKLLLELQAKDDKGDPCVGGVCGRGGGRQGSKSSQTVFSRANSQSNPFGVEPRIGGESLLKKKKIRSISLRSPFKQNQNRTRESQTVSNIPTARPAGCGISHVTWPQQGSQLRGSFYFIFILFFEVKAESRLQCFLATSPLTGTSKLQDSNERLNLLMQNRSACRPQFSARSVPHAPSFGPFIWSQGKASAAQAEEHVGGGGVRPPRTPPPSSRPIPARERRDPRPAAGSADLARSPAPRPPPCFRSPGSASCARSGSGRGREVMLGADYHEKGCAWKSLLHATVNLTKGWDGGDGKGPCRSHQKTWSKLDATQARGGGFRLNLEGCGVKGADASSLARGLKTPNPSFPPFLPLALLSALPDLYPYFLEILSQLPFLHYPFFLSGISLLQALILFPNVSSLSPWFFSATFMCPDLSFRFENTMFHM